MTKVPKKGEKIIPAKDLVGPDERREFALANLGRSVRSSSGVSGTICGFSLSKYESDCIVIRRTDAQGHRADGCELLDGPVSERQVVDGRRNMYWFVILNEMTFLDDPPGQASTGHGLCPIKNDDWPHTCYGCGGPAYHGFLGSQCKSSCHPQYARKA